MQVVSQGADVSRLAYVFRCAPVHHESVWTWLLLMRAQLVVGAEHLGEGLVTGVPFGHGERHISLEVPVSRKTPALAGASPYAP